MADLELSRSVCEGIIDYDSIVSYCVISKAVGLIWDCFPCWVSETCSARVSESGVEWSIMPDRSVTGVPCGIIYLA